MPFQVVTAVYLDLRGPAHFHVDDGIAEHDHGHSHFHGRDGIERHHHPAADESVVPVENAPMLDSHALEEGAPSGWSATMCVALVSAGSALQLPRLTDAIVPGPATRLQTRFPGRLERPPRYHRA
jgi:hypothetical protein